MTIAVIPALVLLVAFSAGCESLPERYSSDKLARIGGDLTDADALYAELGNATLVRDDGRLWIYTWEDSVPYPSRSMLVLEFDTDGKLQSHELARAVKPDRNEPGRALQDTRYCTAGGTCIEHGISSDAGIVFDGTFSAVTVQGEAKERIRPSEPRADECSVVIWPGDGWDESRFATVSTPYGLALSIDGAPRWSYFRWVPTGAFARIVLPAGDHTVAVRDPVWDERMADQDSPPGDDWLEVLDVLLSPPSEASDLPPSLAPFHCWSGEQVFLRVDAAFVEKRGDHWFPIVLRSIEAAEARVLISDMAQVLPSDH